MTVISFAAKREERQPHWQSRCVCLGCRHEWEGVGPMGVQMGLNCPECTLPKGTVKHPFGAKPGDLVLACNCGGETLTAYKRKGRFWVRCMGCGNDLTQAFYEG